MERAGAKSKAALGFLTVLEYPSFGLFGGYLVLNTAGRPLEFHCTAPVKPNRAQEILYGPTLEPFLYGEQIGQTLVAKAKTEPLLVCTDRPPALALRDHIQVPVALVLPDDADEGSESRVAEPHLGGWDSAAQAADPRLPALELVWRIDAAHGGTPLVGFQLGRNRLAVAEANQDDCRLVSERIAQLAESFDLAEPFGRIREAIEEARQGGQPD